jgi:GNAT superfamily N-acetyltransferase
MRISIIQRRLTDLEISELVNETQLFPNLIYISPNHWRRFTNPYCLLVDDHFAGVCTIHDHNNWVKIGPLVLLQRYHGKGLGKILLQHITQNNRNKSLFITSSNPAAQQIVNSLGFNKVSSIFSIPMRILILLAFQSVQYINIRLLSEGIRKKLRFQRGIREYYIKTV